MLLQTGVLQSVERKGTLTDWPAEKEYWICWLTSTIAWFTNDYTCLSEGVEKLRKIMLMANKVLCVIMNFVYMPFY